MKVLDIILSFALQDGNLAPGILTALRAHIDLAELGTIHVVTEDDAEELVAVLPQEIAVKTHVHPQKVRPNYGELLAMANARLASDTCDVVGIVNADVGFASAADATRVLALVEELGGDSAALCLTRHDLISAEDGSPDRWGLTLKDPWGLPNLLTADGWFFGKSVSVSQNMFYCPGQMFCDQFFAHDLIASGTRLFNPCLDCRLLHHGAAHHDSYYAEQVANDTNSARLQRHWVENASGVGPYYGLCPISSQSLMAGYRPSPIQVGERRRKVLVLGDKKPHENIDRARDLVAGEADILLCCRTETELNAALVLLAERGESNEYAILLPDKEEFYRKVLEVTDQVVSGVLCLVNIGSYPQKLQEHYARIVVINNASQLQHNPGAGDHSDAPSLWATKVMPNSIVQTLVEAMSIGTSYVFGWSDSAEHSANARNLRQALGI